MFVLTGLIRDEEHPTVDSLESLSASWERRKKFYIHRTEEIWQKGRDSVEDRLKASVSGVHLLAATRWGISLIFGLCLSSAFLTFHSEVFVENSVVSLARFTDPSFLIPVLLLFFYVFDVARMLVPLAYCSGIIDPEEDIDLTIPYPILRRLVGIGTATLLFLFLASRSLGTIYGYFLFFAFVQLADLFWYREVDDYHLKPLDKAVKKINDILEQLRLEYARYSATIHKLRDVRGIQDDEVWDAVAKLSDSLEGTEELIKNRREEISNKRLNIMCEWKDTIKEIEATISRLRTQQQFPAIAALDGLVCCVIVGLLGLDAEATFVASELKILIGFFLLAHAANIIYDFYWNQTKYILMLDGLAELPSGADIDSGE